MLLICDKYVYVFFCLNLNSNLCNCLIECIYRVVEDFYEKNVQKKKPEFTKFTYFYAPHTRSKVCEVIRMKSCSGINVQQPAGKILNK